MAEWFERLLAQARVLVGAWPTWAAAITAVVAVVADEVVPNLPDNVAVQVAGYLAAVLAAVAAVSAAVSRVTPILFPSEKGLLPLPEAPALEFDVTVLSDSGATPPVRMKEYNDGDPFP